LRIKQDIFFMFDDVNKIHKRTGAIRFFYHLARGKHKLTRRLVRAVISLKPQISPNPWNMLIASLNSYQTD
jgi:hypothetical protein